MVQREESSWFQNMARSIFGQAETVERPKALRVRDDERNIHICLFSDRLEAMAVPIRSMLEKTKQPEIVHVFLKNKKQNLNKMVFSFFLSILYSCCANIFLIL